MKRLFLFLLSISILAGCGVKGEEKLFFENDYSKVTLSVFGKDDEPYHFVIDDDNKVSDIVNKLKDVYKSDNYYSSLDNVELSKGMTYHLEFEDKKFIISYEYLVVEDKVYNIPDYQELISYFEVQFDAIYK